MSSRDFAIQSLIAIEKLTYQQYEKLIDACALNYLQAGSNLDSLQHSAANLFLIMSGTVKFAKIDEDGEQSSLLIIGSGKLIGETQFLGEQGDFEISSLGNVTLLNLGTFGKLTSIIGVKAANMLVSKSLYSKLHSMSKIQHIRLTHKSYVALPLIIEHLINETNRTDDHLKQLKMKQTDLALITGYSRETINRITKESFNAKIVFDGTGFTLCTDRNCDGISCRAAE